MKLLIAIILISGALQEVIIPRQKMPKFKAVAVSGEKVTTVSSEDLRGKYTVLIFYPFDFTYVCPTELIAFSEKMTEFQKLDTLVYGVSTDSHFTHMAWMKTPRHEGGVGMLNYPLISDFSKQMTKNFGFLVTNPEDELIGAALRGLVIVNPEGVVRHV